MKLSKQLRVVLSVAGFAFSVVSFYSHAAIITSDSSVELLALDGKEIETFNSDGGVSLSGGTHQVVYKYYGNVRKGSQKGVIFSTTPYVATIKLSQSDTLKIVSPRLKSYSQADAYFRRGAKWKGLLNNQEVAIDAVKLPGKGLAPYANIETTIAHYNKKQGNQFAPMQNTPMIANQHLQTNPADDTLIQTIQLLYKNASPEQKQRIQAWLLTQ